jgi:hypothetical protein
MSEEAFQILTILLCLLVILDFIFQWFYSRDIYPFDLFHIKPLIVHWYLNYLII